MASLSKLSVLLFHGMKGTEIPIIHSHLINQYFCGKEDENDGSQTTTQKGNKKIEV